MYHGHILFLCIENGEEELKETWGPGVSLMFNCCKSHSASTCWKTGVRIKTQTQQQEKFQIPTQDRWLTGVTTEN